MIPVLEVVPLSFLFPWSSHFHSGWHTLKVWNGCHHLLHCPATSLLLPRSPYLILGLLKNSPAPHSLEQNESLLSCPALNTQFFGCYTADHSVWLIVGFMWELCFLPFGWLSGQSTFSVARWIKSHQANRTADKLCSDRRKSKQTYYDPEIRDKRNQPRTSFTAHRAETMGHCGGRSQCQLPAENTEGRWVFFFNKITL